VTQQCEPITDKPMTEKALLRLQIDRLRDRIDNQTKALKNIEAFSTDSYAKKTASEALKAGS
jgi:hypothetical protein